MQMLNFLRNVLMTFFQDGIWVVGFFYLLTKTFPSGSVLKLAKLAAAVSLGLILLFAFRISI